MCEYLDPEEYICGSSDICEDCGYCEQHCACLGDELGSSGEQQVTEMAQ
jgi:hypothetical protein